MTDPTNIAPALLCLVAMLFVWRVAATIRRVNLGESHDASNWPDDLRDLPVVAHRRNYSGDRGLPSWPSRTSAPPEPTPIYDALVSALGLTLGTAP